MKKLSVVQFNQMKKYENYLNTAVNSGYVRSLPIESAKSIAEVFTYLTGQKANVRCPRCVLAFCKTVGLVYYSYKKEKDERDKRKTGQEDVRTDSGAETEVHS